MTLMVCRSKLKNIGCLQCFPAVDLYHDSFAGFCRRTVNNFTPGNYFFCGSDFGLNSFPIEFTFVKVGVNEFVFEEKLAVPLPVYGNRLYLYR